MEATDKKQNPPSGEWLTSAQAAELVGTVTARTISKWARQVNRRWYVSRSKLLEILNFHDDER